jgi:hypothetical protein
MHVHNPLWWANVATTPSVGTLMHWNSLVVPSTTAGVEQTRTTSHQSETASIAVWRRHLPLHLWSLHLISIDQVSVIPEYQGSIPAREQLFTLYYFITEHCFLPMEAGSCTEFTKKFFYDSSDGFCKEFQYGGCHGNHNQYESREECEHKCGNVQGGYIRNKHTNSSVEINKQIYLHRTTFQICAR